MVEQDDLRAFLEVTQATDENAARELLDSAGSLDAALTLFYENEAPPNQRVMPPPLGSRGRNASRRPPAAGPSSARVSLMEELNQELVADVAPRVPAERPAYVFSVPPLLSLLMLPFQLGTKLANSLLAAVCWLLPQRWQRLPPAPPIPAIERYKLDYAQRHGHDAALPPLFEGSYINALDAARADLKFLVVAIVSKCHESTKRFEQLLTDEQAQPLFSRNDVILWVGDAQNAEAFQVANALRATSLPFIGLIAPSPRTPQSSTVIMAMLLRRPGMPPSARDLAHTVEERMENHMPRLLALRMDRQQHAAARQLREQQDLAYQQSLEADRQRLQAAAQAERAERESRRAREVYAARLNSWIAWRTARFDAQPAEPEGPSARVLMRLPSGERVVRKFAGSDSVRTIYEFVLCKLRPAQTAAESTELSAYPPENFQPKFNFELASPMPRKVLQPSDTPIREELTLWPNGSLNVDYLEEE